MHIVRHLKEVKGRPAYISWVISVNQNMYKMYMCSSRYPIRFELRSRDVAHTTIDRDRHAAERHQQTFNRSNKLGYFYPVWNYCQMLWVVLYHRYANWHACAIFFPTVCWTRGSSVWKKNSMNSALENVWNDDWVANSQHWQRTHMTRCDQHNAHAWSLAQPSLQAVILTHTRNTARGKFETTQLKWLSEDALHALCQRFTHRGRHVLFLQLHDGHRSYLTRCLSPAMDIRARQTGLRVCMYVCAEFLGRRLCPTSISLLCTGFLQCIFRLTLIIMWKLYRLSWGSSMCDLVI